MPSKRIYDTVRCANPCCLRPYFYPHDKRQKFCSLQCRVDYSNDKRSLKEKTLKAYLKKVEDQDKKMSVLYNELEYRSAPIENFMLAIFEIDFTVATKEKHFSSKKEILWFQSYGLVRLNRKGTLYRIISRNDF